VLDISISLHFPALTSPQTGPIRHSTSPPRANLGAKLETELNKFKCRGFVNTVRNLHISINVGNELLDGVSMYFAEETLTINNPFTTLHCLIQV
jgi:hypothetical protein